MAAVVLVLALAGSALAMAQERIYQGDEAEASGVTGIQQHSVFVEIVVEEDKEEKEVHKFAAVVGLIKKCKKVRHTFDNAVLWFNDQFLFGDKDNETRNETPEDALGYNPEDNDLLTRDGNTGRWGGCYTPDGFAFAIGKDDPFGTGTLLADDDVANATVREGCDQAEGTASQNGYDEGSPSPVCGPIDDNMDLVKRLIELDQACKGCIFEYQSSFFISDPNTPGSSQDVSWIVDKLVYPVSVLGNLFQEGQDNVMNGGTCSSDNGTAPFSDPRDDSPHHDRCRDGTGEQNHDCYDECRNETGSTALVEPLFTVHLQVDPLSPEGMGYVDQAPWEYKDGSSVRGMPISQDPLDPAFEDCKVDDRQSYECSIEYNFLLAVDFAAFDDSTTPGEDEVRGDDVRHGRGQQTQDKAWQGNSHAHNPQTFNAGPNHAHDALTLDVFFHDEAPYFVTENAYWDEHGAPPAMDAQCEGPANDPGEERAEAVKVRTPIVCDTDADTGEYHAHDGTETVG